MSDTRMIRMPRDAALKIELDDGLGDVVLTAYGTRGGLAAVTAIARDASSARAMDRLGDDLAAVQAGERGFARAHVGAGRSLKVEYAMTDRDGRVYVVSLKGPRGGFLWTAGVGDDHVDALREAVAAAAVHLTPEADRGA